MNKLLKICLDINHRQKILEKVRDNCRDKEQKILVGRWSSVINQRVFISELPGLVEAVPALGREAGMT